MNLHLLSETQGPILPYPKIITLSLPPSVVPLLHRERWQLNSHFTLLHYTTGKWHVKDSDQTLYSWEHTYKSRSTCIERLKNPMSFPFYLADIAKGVAPAPPPASTTPAGGKKLLQEIFSFDDYSSEVSFDIDGQQITVDLSKAGR